MKKTIVQRRINERTRNGTLASKSLTKNRFKDIDKERVISINNKPLVLFPFEIFEIMTFLGVATGSLNASLDFFVTDTGHQFSFLDNNNNIENELIESTFMQTVLNQNNIQYNNLIKNNKNIK